jgi:hypothetical protein
MKNPREYQFAVELLFHSTMPKECNPHLNFLYYKEFGPHEKFEQAEKGLKLFIGLQKKLGEELIEELNNSSENVKEITKSFYFYGFYYPITITRNTN